MRFRWMAPTLAFALLLAGCVGDDPTSAEMEPAPAANDTPATSAPVPAETTLAPANGTSTEGAQVVPIGWNGKIGTGACAPAAPNTCRSVQFSETDDMHEIDVDGKPLMGNVVLTWKASSPMMDRLVLSFFASKSCGEGCTEGRFLEGRTEGPSPLAVQVSAFGLEEGETLGIVVWTPRMTPSPVYGFVTTEQPFEVKGSLLVG